MSLSLHVSPHRREAGWALLTWGLISLPLLVVSWPPITDLAQHAAQVGLAAKAWAQPDGPLAIQWGTPYLLGYVPLVLGEILLPTAWASRFALVVLAGAWVLANAWLARRYDRSPETAALASLLFFNPSLYWGFLPFVAGWPVFVLWYGLLSRPVERVGPGEAIRIAILAALLFYTHVLWFAAGVGWLLARAALGLQRRRIEGLRFLGTLPVIIAAGLWYPTLGAGNFDSPTRWFWMPWERLGPDWWSRFGLGGLQGWTEPLTLLVLGGWLLGGLFPWSRARRALAERREPLLAAAVFAVPALLLPDLHQNTILFAARWAPFVLVFLLVALPAPRLPANLRGGVAAMLATAFVLSTTFAWLTFEADEMNGFEEALAEVRPGDRVLGLDVERLSDVVRFKPFLQQAAWAQALRGADTNFSFAEFANMPVVYREGRDTPWTRGLEWWPDRLRAADLEYFDFVLLNAEPKVHKAFVRRFGVVPVTGLAPWGLYRIERPEVVPAAP